MAYSVQLDFFDVDDTKLELDVFEDGHFETRISPPPKTFVSMPLFDIINSVVATARKLFDQEFVHEFRVTKHPIV